LVFPIIIIIIIISTEIQELELGKTYKYLELRKVKLRKVNMSKRKTEEGTHQEIKNDAEIRVKCHQ
jgi:hypothetical protein